MKRFALLVVCLAFAALSVAADYPSYARINRSDVYLLTEPTYLAENRLLKLTDGYYIRVIADDGLYYKVALPDAYDGTKYISGYILKEDCEINGNPTLPLVPKLTVKLAADADITLPNSVDGITVAKEKEVVFIGEYSHDKLYVRYGDAYGYIDRERVLSYEIPRHPQPLESTVEMPLDTAQPDNQTINPNDLFAILLLLTSTVVCLTVWLLVKRK